MSGVSGALRHRVPPLPQCPGTMPNWAVWITGLAMSFARDRAPGTHRLRPMTFRSARRRTPSTPSSSPRDSSTRAGPPGFPRSARNCEVGPGVLGLILLCGAVGSCPRHAPVRGAHRLARRSPHGRRDGLGRGGGPDRGRAGLPPGPGRHSGGGGRAVRVRLRQRSLGRRDERAGCGGGARTRPGDHAPVSRRVEHRHGGRRGSRRADGRAARAGHRARDRDRPRHRGGRAHRGPPLPAPRAHRRSPGPRRAGRRGGVPWRRGPTRGPCSSACSCCAWPSPRAPGTTG